MVALYPGTDIEGHTLVRPLGKGGYGEVWEASAARYRVAIKFLSLESREAQVRFDSEAKALRDVVHPNCVRFLGGGTLPDGVRYIVMEYVDGVTLARWCRTEHSIEEKLDVAYGIADALTAIHGRGIVHRDLKPANLIISERDGRWHPMVLDFGISKLQGWPATDITKTGAVIGTPGFMSPEQLRGQKDVYTPTDIYALGCIFHLLFDGQDVFSGDSPLGIAMAHLSQPPPTLRHAPLDIAELTGAMLEKDPTHRPNAAAVARALKPRQSTVNGVAVRQQGSPNRRIAIGAVVFVTLVLVAATWIALRPTPVPKAIARPSPNPTSLLRKAPVDQPEKAKIKAQPAVLLHPQCAELPDFAPGVHHLAGTEVRLPKNYDRSRQHPVILLFHDAHADNESILASLDNDALDADENGYIIIAPQGAPMETFKGHWSGKELFDRVRGQISAAKAELCVRRDREFLVAHGKSGNAAARLACESDVTGVGVFAWRGSTLRCLADKDIPLLAIYPMQDSLAPADGSEDCNFENSVSVQQHVEKIRNRRRIKGKPELRKVRGGTCKTHNDTLITCEIEGGRRWPLPTAPDAWGTETRWSLRGCPPGPRPTFPITAEILRFFDRIEATPK